MAPFLLMLALLALLALLARATEREMLGRSNWQRWVPPTWLRATVITGCGYFLLATSKVPDDEPPDGGPTTTPTTCVEGLETGPATIVVGAAEAAPETTEATPPSCGSFDTLRTGSMIALQLFASRVGDDPTCLHYDTELVGSLPVEGDLTDTSAWSTSGTIAFAVETERSDEPGCRFTYAMRMEPREQPPVNANDERRFDATTTPLVLSRSIVFPQVHFCSGVADTAARGEYTCEDHWSATLEVQ